MQKFIIAEICFEIFGTSLDVFSWREFSVQEEKINKSNFIIVFENNVNVVYNNVELYKETEGAFVIRTNRDILIANQKWDKIIILPLYEINNRNVFILQAFYTHAVKRHMIQVHSSLIDYQGRGIMFLGPSGIGKTTQAERWNEYRGAVIINGDMVFVQETEDQFLGWGTPWHGSSPYCENASVPLEALVILKQSPVNRIRRLEGFEMVAEVSNSVFYPTWLENGMDLCLETLDHLLTHVPVYLLENRADEEAVTLLEQTLDQNKKE